MRANRPTRAPDAPVSLRRDLKIAAWVSVAAILAAAFAVQVLLWAWGVR